MLRNLLSLSTIRFSFKFFSCQIILFAILGTFAAPPIMLAAFFPLLYVFFIMYFIAKNEERRVYLSGWLFSRINFRSTSGILFSDPAKSLELSLK